MKLLIVGLGSMGKRRARLSKGIDAALHIVGVDTAEARRAEACTLGLADAAYPTIAEAVAAEHPDAALVPLADNLLRRGDKTSSLCGGGDPLGTALKNRETQFRLQLMHCGTDGRLRHKQCLRSLVDRAAAVDLQNILQLSKVHFVSL